MKDLPLLDGVAKNFKKAPQRPRSMILASCVGVAACLLLAISAQGAATTYNVDFNTANTGGYPTGTGTWNSYAAPSDINGSTLTSSVGAASTITLSVAGTITDSSANTTAVTYNNTSNNPSWVASTTANGAAGDYFFTSNLGGAVQDTFTLTLGGFTAGSQVSLSLLASHGLATGITIAGYYSYSLDGGTTWLGFNVVDYLGNAVSSWDGKTTLTQGFDDIADGYTNHDYMTSSFTMTGTTLLIKVQDTATGNAYSVLNAMSFTTAVPEPSTWAMLVGGVGMLAFGQRLRRRV